jgi:hypothetical protein
MIHKGDNQRRTDNTMVNRKEKEEKLTNNAIANRKRRKGQKVICKRLQSQLKNVKHVPHLNLGRMSCNLQE